MTSTLPEPCFMELGAIELAVICIVTFTAILLMGLIFGAFYRGIKKFLFYTNIVKRRG